MFYLSRHCWFHSNLVVNSSVDANMGVGQGELPSLSVAAGALCVEATVSVLRADMDTQVGSSFYSN